MTLITATQISLKLGKKMAVTQADISIARGEMVGLIGPNGAGKSSALRILAGLVKPNTGSVALSVNGNSQPLEKIPAQSRARLIAYLAQHETPAWPLSVKNVVALGRSPWNSSVTASATEEIHIETAMHMTEVANLAERPVTELSGGELQRVLLARVFAGQPELIIADEPIAALDVYHQLHVMELLQAHAQQGGAVIAALHDLSLAARFCSRLILMHQGKIIAQGEPAQVLSAQNLAQVYGVSAHIDCSEHGVVVIPTQRIAQL